MAEFSFFMPIAKIDKEKRTVSGYASTETKDSDGEIVSLDAVKKALPGYMMWGNVREMHRLSAVGTAQEAHVDQKGLFLTAKIVDHDAWNKCLEGVYKGFSIGGRKLDKLGKTITDLDLTEISVVDRPANPDCRITVAKVAGLALEPIDGFELIQKIKKTPEEKQAAKITKAAAQVSEFLKVRPPAAKDGLSLPAPDPNVSPKDSDTQNNKTQKREYSDDQRKEYARSGVAMPDGSFPIPDKDALDDAISAYGRVGDKPKAKRHIMSRARALGAEDMIPDKWKKKAEAKAARKAAFASQISPVEKVLPSSLSAQLPFLTLSAETGGSRPSHDALGTGQWELPRKGSKIKKSMQTAGDLAFCFDSVRRAQRSLVLEAQREGRDKKDLTLARSLGSVAQALAEVIGQKASHEGAEALDLSDADDRFMVELLGEDFEMAINDNDIRKLAQTDPLGAQVLGVIKRAATPTRAMRMKAARGNLKKARGARKECAKAVRSAFEACKAHYINKANKPAGKKPEGDADDFDSAGVAEKLQKAWSELEKVNTFMKAASVQLKKAAARSGQRGQETSDGDPGFYEVPPGVTDLTPAALAGAAPGTKGGGSQPPMYPGDGSTYAGKIAKAIGKDGRVDATTAILLAENAALERTNQVLTNMGGRGTSARPYGFDLTKVATPPNGAIPSGGGGGDPMMKAIVDAGVSFAQIENDENARGKAVGTYLMKYGAKSVFDADFKGGAIGRS